MDASWADIPSANLPYSWRSPCSRLAPSAHGLLAGRLVHVHAAWTGLRTFPMLALPRSVDLDHFAASWPSMVLVDIVPPGRVRYRRLGPEVI